MKGALMERYTAISGKNCNLITDILAKNDQAALKKAAEIGGVRLVKKADGTTIFEDYENPLSFDHLIFFKN